MFSFINFVSNNSSKLQGSVLLLIISKNEITFLQDLTRMPIYFTFVKLEIAAFDFLRLA
jgi:hypothetical protein